MATGVDVHLGRSAIKRLTEHKEKLIDLIANQRAAVDQFEIVDAFFGEHELIDRKFLSVLGGVDFRGPRISAKSDDILGCQPLCGFHTDAGLDLQKLLVDFTDQL
jgi:hypothetical protein